MLSLCRTLSLGYWRRHRTRALLLALSIALGVATWAATRALAHTLDRALRSAATPLAGAADLYVGNGDAGVPRDLAEPLRSVPGVRSVQPLVLQRAVLPDLGQQPVLLLGIDLQQTAGGDRPAWDVQVTEHTASDYLRCMILGRKPVLVGKQLDQALPPDATQVTVLAAGSSHRFLRAGTIDGRGPAAALGGNVLVLSCDDAAELFGRLDRVNRLDVTLTPGADRADVRRRLEEVLAGRARVWTPEGHDERIQDMLTGLWLGFFLCGAGALVVGLFLIGNTLAVSVAERRADVGILRAVGATRAQVAGLFLAEAAVLGLTGAVLGLPLGLGLAHLCLGPMHRILSDLFVPLPGQQIQVTGFSLLHALAAGVLTTLLASLLPALHAARADPVAALSRVPVTPGRLPLRLWIGGSLALALLGLGCTAGGARLPPRVGSYGGLVLLLLAALLATPLLAVLLGRLLQWLTRYLPGVIVRLAAGNLVRAPGRTGLVCTALAAGVALLLQTAGLIRSNEEAVRGWVDQSIAGDLFVTAGGPLSASGRTLPMAEPLSDWISDTCPGARVVSFRFRHLDWGSADHTGRVLLVALDAGAYYEVNRGRRPPLPDLELYGHLREPGTVLVSENFAALHGFRAGDRLTLPGVDGPVALRVLGTVADYSCQGGTLVVDRAQQRQAFDADLVDVFDVYLPAGADAEAARRQLQQAPAAASLGLCVLTRADMRGHLLGMVQRLYGLAYTQEIVVGVVAVLGVVTALLIAVLQRRRELGLLRAVGATRGQVLCLVLAEAFFLGLLGTVLGLLLGAPLEWYTVRILLFEESGFLCPVRTPWLTAAAVAGVALASATVAGLGPALHALRPSIADTIACE